MMTVEPTLWGLTPVQLHDRFWAARGVQVVRAGEGSEIVEDAELFLLIDARSLVLFSLAPLLSILSWTRPRLLIVRLLDRRDRGYREYAQMDGNREFLGFRRCYGGSDTRLARVALTRSRDVALAWLAAPNATAGWRRLRRVIPASARWAAADNGAVFDRTSWQELTEFSRLLVQAWNRPDATIPRVIQHGHTWVDRESQVADSSRLIGPLWIGAGRRIPRDVTVVGPSVLWDDPSARPSVELIRWSELEPTNARNKPLWLPRRSRLDLAGKRLFDLAFASLALAITVPFYPLIMLAIWLEDGRPIFFAHRRETQGGRAFPCLKFRSMRRNAETLKLQLRQQNRADGPQFFIDKDPRLTRVGAVLRKFNIDELPQFWNVLLGQMSVVGPRPSPRQENQYCPAWREARLSVRPGITGLWQIMRTRKSGADFQEWIKYDIAYVERAGWRLDLWILLQTVRLLLAGKGNNP